MVRRVLGHRMGLELLHQGTTTLWRPAASAIGTFGKGLTSELKCLASTISYFDGLPSFPSPGLARPGEGGAPSDCGQRQTSVTTTLAARQKSGRCAPCAILSPTAPPRSPSSSLRPASLVSYTLVATASRTGGTIARAPSVLANSVVGFTDLPSMYTSAWGLPKWISS